jgi:hypothetical protein
VYTFYLLGPYAAVRMAEVALRSRRPGPASLRALGLLVGVGLAAGIAGVQIVPSLEAVGESWRAGPLSPREVHYLAGARSQPGAGFLARAIDPSPKLVTFDYGRGSGYVGLPTLIMLGVGIVAGRRRPLVWLLLVVGGVAFLLSDGYRGWGGGLYERYAALPTGSLFRTPERFRLLTLFGAIAVATVGFDVFARRDPRPPAATLGLLTVGLSSAGVIAFLGPPAAAWRAVVAATLLALVVVWPTRPTVRLGAQGAMLLLLVADLAWATGPYGSLRAFPKTWSERFSLAGHTVMDDDTFAALSRELRFDRVAFHGLQPAIGADPIDEVHRADCRETLIPKGWPLFPWSAGREPLAPFYDVASVRVVFHVDLGADPALAARALTQADLVFRKHRSPLPTPPPGIGVKRVTNADALARAYVAHRWTVTRTEEALRHVTAGDVDFHRVVLLDRDPGITGGGQGGVVPAAITAYAPERVAITVDAPAPGVLVLTDSYYPGWRARVDGTDREIIRANGLFRAVAVPAGRREVVFEYRPESLRRGMAISALSLGILALGLVVARRVRRPGRSP